MLFRSQPRILPGDPRADPSERSAPDRSRRAAQTLADPLPYPGRPKAQPKKPVALLADTSRGGSYRAAEGQIRAALGQLNYDLEPLDTARFDQDHAFLEDLGKYAVLICEVRSPSIRPDLFGLVHGAAVPTIRVGYLKAREREDEATAAMRLSLDAAEPSRTSTSPWPVLLSRYQIDRGMEPVLFWRRPEDLAAKVADRIKAITERLDDLETSGDARNYFLRFGRMIGKSKGVVFLSNSSSQNSLVERLRQRLDYEAVDTFHYLNLDQMSSSVDDWRVELDRVIASEDTVAFLAIIDERYNDTRGLPVGAKGGDAALPRRRD